MASTIAAGSPRLGMAWPWARTRPSTHRASAIRCVAAMTSAESGLSGPGTGMAERTASEVSLCRKNRSRNASIEKQARGSSSPQAIWGKSWPRNGVPSQGTSGVIL